MPRKRWKNPDRRMAMAVEMRRRGMSLRQIGTELAVSEGTIRNDLTRWESQQEASSVACEVVPLRSSVRNQGAQLRSDYASEITQEGAS